MNHKIDGSFIEAAKKGIENLTSELSPADRQKFLDAYGKVIFLSMISKAPGEGETKGPSYLRRINGKTPKRASKK